MPDDIKIAQKGLRTILADAQAGEDKELALHVRELGEQFARLLCGLFRLHGTYTMDNKVFEKPITDFCRVQEKLSGLLGTIHLVCVEEQVYVNDIRIRFPPAAEHIDLLGKSLHLHKVGGLSFHGMLSPDHVRKLVQLVMSPPAPAAPRKNLESRFLGEGIQSLELQPIFRFLIRGEAIHTPSRSFEEIYAASSKVVAEAYTNLAASRLPNPLPLRRLVIDLVETVRAGNVNELCLEPDVNMPPYVHHVLMVNNLSVLIGSAAGLEDAVLCDLGVTGMLHDVGVFLDEDGVPVSYARHNRAGFRVMARQRGFHAAKINRLLAILQHHRPLSDRRGPPSLFARIIRIADDYDSLTRKWPTWGPELAVPDALTRMAVHAGTVYDPDLFQLFVNQVGKFPPGSILCLASGALVVSISGVRNENTFDRPLCRVLRTGDGTTPDQPQNLDLAQEDEVVEILRPGS